jgi:N-methylhydantoinase A
MVDITTVGAGGGSLASVDAGGALRVGPASAGADPGPVCYGKGGTQPTITDANLVLGRLNPDRAIGDGIELQVERARDAIETEIADPMDVDVETAAASVLEVAYAVLTRNIRKVTIERGHDPERFALVGFGGMGPQVAVDIAAEMGMGSVIIPRNPGVFSARGLLMADFRIQEATSFPTRGVGTADMVDAFDELRQTILSRMDAQGFGPEAVTVEYGADMRYEGQAYELTIPLASGRVAAESVDAGLDDFHDHHRRRYGYAVPENDVEITTIRATGIVPADADSPAAEAGAGDPRIDRRSVYFPDDGFVDTDIYWRTDIDPASSIRGPAVIEEADSTTVIPPDATAEVSGRGNVVVSLEQSQSR